MELHWFASFLLVYNFLRRPRLFSSQDDISSRDTLKCSVPGKNCLKQNHDTCNEISEADGGESDETIVNGLPVRPVLHKHEAEPRYEQEEHDPHQDQGGDAHHFTRSRSSATTTTECASELVLGTCSDLL